MTVLQWHTFPTHQKSISLKWFSFSMTDGYIENGVEKISLAHSHTLVSAYAEWTDKSGERKGINGKNFETKARLTALNNAVDKMCREEFGVEYLIGEGKNGKTVEQLKAESQLEKTRLDNEKLSAENQTKIKQVISDFATGKGTKKIATAEKIIENAELANETLCKTRWRDRIYRQGGKRYARAISKRNT